MSGRRSSKAPPIAARPPRPATTSKADQDQDHSRCSRARASVEVAGFQPGTAPGAAVGRRGCVGLDGPPDGRGVGRAHGWADRDTGGGTGSAAGGARGCAYPGADAPTGGEPAAPEAARGWPASLPGRRVRRTVQVRPAEVPRSSHRRRKSAPIAVPHRSYPRTVIEERAPGGDGTHHCHHPGARCRAPSRGSAPYRRTSVRKRWARVAAGPR